MADMAAQSGGLCSSSVPASGSKASGCSTLTGGGRIAAQCCLRDVEGESERGEAVGSGRPLKEWALGWLSLRDSLRGWGAA